MEPYPRKRRYHRIAHEISIIMLYLFLSIVINALLFVIFKYFSIYKVNNLHAIVVNYFVAFLVGFFFDKSDFSMAVLPEKPWFTGTLFLGVLFITFFNVIALTTQKTGLSVVSISSKMSVVVPVIFAFILYNDHITLLKIVGILMALLALYMVTKKTASLSVEKKYLYLPVLLFAGTGLIDTLFKYIELHFVKPDETYIFSAIIFLTAGVSGVIFLIVTSCFKPIIFKLKSLIAGVILGIPNFFSVYFLLEALKTNGLESSYVYPVNNVGIVLLSTLFGILLFNEKLTNFNKIGILIAISGIVLMNIASW